MTNGCSLTEKPSFYSRYSYYSQTECFFFASEANGSSDDIDQPLRRLFADQDLVKSYGLMSLNSVNWSRVMIQLAHFIYTYLELSGMEQAEADGELPELEVVVPTGGAGNIAGELITAVREIIQAVTLLAGCSSRAGGSRVHGIFEAICLCIFIHA